MRKIMKLLSIVGMTTMMVASVVGCNGNNSSGDETTTKKQAQGNVDYMEENKKVTGLKIHYNMTTGKTKQVLTDISGNGNDGKLMTLGEDKIEDNVLFIGEGSYVKLPETAFVGEETLSISVWLKNYSGATNTAAMYIGAKPEKDALPTAYWLFNPCNPSGKLKSVITNSDNPVAPFNTEVGIGPSKASNGKEGPYTDMGWNHYVTIITANKLTVYLNGELVGTQDINRSVIDFGEDLVAFIGKSSYDDPTFQGFIKEVKIYDTELTEAEIKAEYELNKDESKTNATESEIFIADRADPYITKGPDGYYYFTGSYPMYGGGDKEGYDRVVLRRSKTIEGLKDAEEITIWDEKTSSEANRFIWAPEIHCIEGKWYVFCAASVDKNNVWGIRCFVLMCEGDDPYTDKWVEKGYFQPAEKDTVSFTNFSLDMTYFEAAGKHYVVWAQTIGASSLCIAEIDPNEPWKAISKATVITKPEYYWEKVKIAVNEGPAVVKHDGKVFLAYSASATGPEYCIGLLCAEEGADLLSRRSWTKLEEPVLTSADLIDEYGPGHNSFTVDEEGNTIFVYHSRSKKCYEGKCGYGHEDSLFDPCRSAHIRKVVWDENGFPILNQ